MSSRIGRRVGKQLGARVGRRIGIKVGTGVGRQVGRRIGIPVGTGVGTSRSGGRTRVLRRSFDIAQAAAAAVAIWRIAQGAQRLPRLTPVTSGAKEKVTVVVPARDEALRIGPCLGALARDDQVGEVIVVDDESTDATAEVAIEAGARVITGQALPAGWVGKPWALQQGLLAASGDWILTMDADVIPKPGLVGALLDTADQRGWDVVSAGPRFVCRDRAQRALHGSMLATLVYRFGPVGPRHPPRAHRALANGQCLLVRRSWLLERGGFAVTGGHMTDDIALVRWLAGIGARTGFVDGSAVVEVEMHQNVGEVWREWGRSLPMPDVTTWQQQSADLAVIWLVMALPVVRLLARRTRALDRVLIALRVAMCGALRGAYVGPGPELWMSWLADPASAWRLTTGALRPTRTWRGRVYR